MEACREITILLWLYFSWGKCQFHWWIYRYTHYTAHCIPGMRTSRTVCSSPPPSQSAWKDMAAGWVQPPSTAASSVALSTPLKRVSFNSQLLLRAKTKLKSHVKWNHGFLLSCLHCSYLRISWPSKVIDYNIKIRQIVPIKIQFCLFSKIK